MDRKVLNQIIIAIIIAFTVLCMGLLTSIFNDMNRQANFISEQDNENQKKEYTIWITNDIDKDTIKSIYTSYDEKDLGLKINITTFSSDIYGETLITSGMTNKLPDMFYIEDQKVLNKLVDMGVVMDLSKYIAEKDIAKDFVSGALEGLQVNQRNYGIPIRGWNEVLYCNKTIFEKCGLRYPINYEEFIACIKTFKSKDIISMSFGGSSFKASELYYRMLVEDNGSLEESAKLLEKLVELEPFSVDYMSMQTEEAASRFENGESAMFLGTSNDAYRFECSNQKKENTVVVECPTISEKNTSIGGYTCGFVLNANSKLNQMNSIKDYYENTERKLSWELVIQQGRGLPVYRNQQIENTRFKILGKCNEFMYDTGCSNKYENLLKEYKTQNEIANYKLQILRLMHGQIDSDAFLSALRL